MIAVTHDTESSLGSLQEREWISTQCKSKQEKEMLLHIHISNLYLKFHVVFFFQFFCWPFKESLQLSGDIRPEKIFGV